MAKHKKRVTQYMLGEHQRLANEAYYLHLCKKRLHHGKNTPMFDLERSHVSLVQNTDVSEKIVLQIEHAACDKAIRSATRQRLWGNLIAIGTALFAWMYCILSAMGMW